MISQSSIPFLASLSGLLGSCMLILPAVRADRYFSSAYSAKTVVDKLNTLQAGQTARHENNGEPDHLADSFGQLMNELDESAKKWTPAMSLMLRGGIFFMMISGVLRIWINWPG